MTQTKLKTRMSAANRREAIEQVAGPLFGRDGYAATRLDDVAAAAGVTKPIVYRHFASKKDLYIALLERHERDLPTFVAELDIDTSGSREDMIAAILDGWLDYVAQNSWSWQIIFRDHTADPDIEAARRSVNMRARVVMAGLVEQLWPDLEERLVQPMAEFVSRGLAGLVLWWIDNPEVSKDDVHEVASRATVALLLH